MNDDEGFRRGLASLDSWWLRTGGCCAGGSPEREKSDELCGLMSVVAGRASNCHCAWGGGGLKNEMDPSTYHQPPPCWRSADAWFCVPQRRALVVMSPLGGRQCRNLGEMRDETRVGAEIGV